MSDANGLAEARLGLDGLRVLKVTERPDEVVIDIETSADFTGCRSCGTRAEPRTPWRWRSETWPASGRPARLVWRKRRWPCPEAHCEAKTWTETSIHVSARTVLTRRAGVESCRQVGANSRPVPAWLESSGCAGGR